MSPSCARAVIAGALTSWSLTATAAGTTSEIAPQGAVEIGARVGYGVPLGSAAHGIPMRDALAAKVPIWIDAGYRIRDRLYLGGYLEYAYGAGTPRSTVFCPAPDGTTSTSVSSPGCTMRDFRFGANVHVHLQPHAAVDPWLGAGLGYEVLTRRETNTSVRGWELVNLQAGVDVAVGDELLVGAFTCVSVARYTLAAWTTLSAEDTAAVSEPATHGWFTFGIRAAFRTLRASRN